MEADEINQGLTHYMWPDGEWPVDEWLQTKVESTATGGTRMWVLFTASLDACEKVAEKLGGVDFQMRTDPDEFWCEVALVNPGFLPRFGHYGTGPTRSHALAAALWAAVRGKE